MLKIIPIVKPSEFVQRPLVMCHGCFDLLHIGHVWHLYAAKTMGRTLLVTVTADEFVNKGSNRPVFPAQQRAEMLSSLECVDYVAINYADDPCEAIKIIRPDLYVKGSDYKGTSCAEFNTVEEYGGRVAFTPTEKFSTTELIERIRK